MPPSFSRFRFVSPARGAADRQLQDFPMPRSFRLASAAMAAALAIPTFAYAQIGDQGDPATTGPSAIDTVTVTARKLDNARVGIQTQTGASTYTISAQDIQNAPGGDNGQLNSVILQAPSVAQ